MFGKPVPLTQDENRTIRSGFDIGSELEMQLRELREYAAARKWTVFAEYVDTGWSGAKASRPELNRLMADARKRRFDAVCVWKLDRWGRSVADSIKSIQELTSLGVRFIAVTRTSTRTSQPDGAVPAELERSPSWKEIIRELSLGEGARANGKSRAAEARVSAR
jgi:DNA invertase Pin-like site-specific DNA recombinase